MNYDQPQSYEDDLYDSDDFSERLDNDPETLEEEELNQDDQADYAEDQPIENESIFDKAKEKIKDWTNGK